MFDDLRALTIDKLPEFLRPIAEHARESERVKNEQRRSVLAKEVQAARAAYAKSSRALVDAADRARSRRDAAWADFCAARNASDAANAARDGASCGNDHSVGTRLCEIRSLADPRIAACREEMLGLADAMRNARPEEHIMKIREVSSPRIESNAMIRQVTRVRTNVRLFRKRVEAIAAAIAELDRMSDTADYDVGKALAKVRASIPKTDEFEDVDVTGGGFTVISETPDETLAAEVANAVPPGPRGPNEWVGRAS